MSWETQLLSGDGLRAVAKKGKEAKEYATANNLKGDTRDRFIKAMKSSVKDARRARLSAKGNKMLFGRGELGWFKKNGLVPTRHAATVENSVHLAEEAIAAGMKDGASALEKLLGKVAQKDPGLVEGLATKIPRGTDPVEYLKTVGERLSNSSHRDTRALGKLYRTQGEALATALDKIDSLGDAQAAQVLNTAAENTKNLADWFKKLIVATSELGTTP